LVLISSPGNMGKLKPNHPSKKARGNEDWVAACHLDMTEKGKPESAPR
jgi:hypothetical protein